MATATAVPPPTEGERGTGPARRHERPPGRSTAVLDAARWVRRHTDRVLAVDESTIDERSGATPRILFALSALAYPLYQLLTRGELFVAGSMWAEMGTNYYALSTSPSLRERLFGTDAGYIPLPQRLIALAGQELGIPASAVPYLYTGSALVLSGLMIAVFCLPAFRPVIASDGLRFLVTLALTLVPDFETRTFINFTYFAVAPAATLTALAFVQRGRPTPAWAWVLPLILLSKPGVLAVVPAMVLAALVSDRRFRLIAIASSAVAVVQVLTLARNASASTSLLQASDESPLSRLITSLKYALGFTTRFVVGPDAALGTTGLLVTGLVVVVVCLAASVLLTGRAAALVVVGLSLILFTLLLDGFTFSAAFTRDMLFLAQPGFDRRVIVAIIGAFLVVAGFIALVLESPRVRSLTAGRPRLGAAGTRPALATAAFALWFLAAGWLTYVPVVNGAFGLPIAGVSQWERLSPLLTDPAQPVVCIPLDPFSWAYGKNCSVMVGQGAVPFYYGWSAVPATEGSSSVDLPVPTGVGDGRLASLAIMVQPPATTGEVSGRAVLTDADGDVVVLDGVAEVPAGGGLLQFMADPGVLVPDVRTVRLEFDESISLAATDPASGPQTAVVLWMGQPATP